VTRARVRPQSEPSGGRKPRSPGRQRTLLGFYAQALDEAERLELARAAEVEGLDEEIALLRLRIRQALTERPDDLPLMVRGIELLIKALAARYRITKEEEQDLAESMVNVLKGIGGVVYPEVFGDGRA
jgi:hypothetical protein